MAECLQNWIGRAQTQTDYADEARIQKLAALLDYDTAPWVKNELPPLAHWLCFSPAVQQSKLDKDGHPQRGNFMPPIKLPRRMWASSDVVFREPVSMNQNLQQRSEILDISPKTSQNGEKMIFVKIKHEISGQKNGRIEENQHIVYRQAPPLLRPSQKSNAPMNKKIKFQRNINLDSMALFRFSALTFNAHRIHYDRDYASREGYDGLVVHGPLLAIMLLNHFLSHYPQKSPRRFHFRAQRPLLDISMPARLALCENDELLAQNKDGEIVMTAGIECAP